MYSFGCYQTKGSNPILRELLSSALTGTNVIQRCLSIAKSKRNKNYQGIGVRKFTNSYGCYADENAELRYTLYGPANNCGSEGLGTPGSNATAVFLFSGEH